MKLRILIVDDQRLNQVALKGQLTSILKQMNQTPDIELANFGETGVEKIKTTTEPFDCIFMDQQMPGIGGLEAIRQLRAFETEKQLKPNFIIAWSSDDMIEMKKAGANETLPKNVSNEALKNILTSIISTKQSLQTSQQVSFVTSHGIFTEPEGEPLNTSQPDPNPPQSRV